LGRDRLAHLADQLDGGLVEADQRPRGPARNKPQLHTILGPKGWQLLRTIGMNVILYAFLKDFMQDPSHGALLDISPSQQCPSWLL
jgi:hypothetical protein